jgi:hypothetical protein
MLQLLSLERISCLVIILVLGLCLIEWITIQVASLSGRLLALPSHIMPGRKGMPGTNTPGYLASLSVMRQNVL